MTRRPCLTYQGSDIALCRQEPNGKVLVVYLDHLGRPTPHRVDVWPHELRGIGWHLAEIKACIELLPVQGAPLNRCPNPPAVMPPNVVALPLADRFKPKD